MIIGEGGSGGAIALAAAMRLSCLSMRFIPSFPEGCAGILWRLDQARAAAEAMNLTAQDLDRFGVIDEIVPNLLGGTSNAALCH